MLLKTRMSCGGNVQGLIISKSSCEGLLGIFNVVFKHVVDLFQNQLMSVFVLRNLEASRRCGRCARSAAIVTKYYGPYTAARRISR